MVPLKYLNNFSKILEMPLIFCGINPNLNWSRNCVKVANNADEAATFSITDTKLYVLVVTLSTKDNAKLLQHLKSSLKLTVNWNKYQSKISTKARSQNIDFYLIPAFKE